MGQLIKFSHVNEHGDFAAVLAHYSITEYKRTGDQLRLRCPLPDHEDTNPSFSVTLAKTDQAEANTWHCFGCHQSGSIIDLVAIMDGVDLRTAATTVATVSGCALAPPKSGGKRKAKGKRSGKGQEAEKLPETPAEAADDHSPPTTDEKAPDVSETISTGNPPLKFAFTSLQVDHPYVQARATPGMIAEFGLGYLPAPSKSMMVERVCIPIHNQAGELIAYAGRYPGIETPEGTEKYLLPKQFAKLDVLFNLHRVARDFAAHETYREFVVVVEGFFGAMWLHELGIPAVAVMGTAMSEAQADALHGLGIRRVLVMLDGDEAGARTTPAIVSLLTRSFFVKVATLPDGLDPDTAGGQLVRELIA